MTELISRRALFGNPVRASYQISPDGRHLAWLAPVDDVLNLWVGPLDDPDMGRAVTRDRGRGISFYGWTYDPDRLVYVQDKDGDENNHVYCIDLSTDAVRDLTPVPGVAAYPAAISRIVRDRILIAINDRDPRYHDLYSVDLATGARELVQENPDFAGFVTDESYEVRVGVRTHPDGSTELLRPSVDGWDSWFRFSPEDARVSGVNHVDAAGRFLFCRDSRGRDTAALARIAFADGAATIIAEDAKADIGSVIVDVESHEPLAFAVNHERLRWHALDERLGEEFAWLDAQTIGDWRLASRTENDRLWVLVSNSDTRPARTYIFDRQARSLRDLGSARPELESAPLAPMRTLTIRSRDGLDLVSYLTRPLGTAEGVPVPLVLLVHGGPWGRDSFGFDAAHQWLANRGYAVLSVNFRASVGFGKAFVNAGDHEWGRRMDDDLLDAIDWALREGIADPRRIAIMGGSYGGYATLASLTRNPDLYACGVDIVGPSNLETLLRTVPPYWESFRAQLNRAVGDPDTEEGMALIRERSPVHFADRIRAPLLIAQGANDPRVKRAEADQMVAAMAANDVPVTYLLFPDEGHGFVRPQNRLAFNARAEAFLARHLGGREEPEQPGETDGTTLEVVRDDPARG